MNIDDRSLRQGDESSGESPVRLLIGLDGANKFPRELVGGMQAGIGVGQFGPLDIGSPIKEDPKFMTVSRLKWLYEHPEKGRQINDVVAGFLRRDQQTLYLQHVADELNRGDRKAAFLPVVREEGDSGSAPRTVATGRTGRSCTLADDVSAKVVPALKVEQDSELQVRGIRPDAIRLDYYRPGESSSHQTSRNLNIRVRPESADGIVNVTIEMLDRTPQGATRPMSGQYTELVTVMMPDDVKQLSDRKVGYYAHSPVLTSRDKIPARARDRRPGQRPDGREQQPRQLRSELPDPGDGRVRPGNDVPQRELPDCFRGELHPGIAVHHPDRRRPADLPIRAVG